MTWLSRVCAVCFALLLLHCEQRQRPPEWAIRIRLISTALLEYSINKGGYPPAYGYWTGDDKNGDPLFYAQSYLQPIGLSGTAAARDPFSASFDTNGDGIVSRLEFAPEVDASLVDGAVATKGVTGKIPYPANDALRSPYEQRQRDYVYVPYNTSELLRFATHIAETSDKIRRTAFQKGDAWPADFYGSDALPATTFDGFVLISVGPTANTGGILTPNDEDAWLAKTGAAPRYYYNLLGLRAAYLATRDLNKNGFFDFDNNGRTREGELVAFPEMPDGSSSPGPHIYAQNAPQ